MATTAAPLDAMPRWSRRHWLRQAGAGFGAIALNAMLADERARAMESPPQRRSFLDPPRDARAKRVLFLFMDGGPSHLDLMDRKPLLQDLAGQTLPASFGRVDTAMGVGSNKLLASKRKWKRYGAGGIEISDWLPHIGQHCMDDFLVIRSLWADGRNHAASVCQMNTGSLVSGRPSFGAWVTYGLGTENQNLPAFVVLTDTELAPPGGAQNWGAGFLPSQHQGLRLLGGPSPILFLERPAGISAEQEMAKRELLAKLNRLHLDDRPGDRALEGRIAAYESAYRLQAEAPSVFDLSAEDRKVRTAYGLHDKRTAKVGRNCLIARRLLERGVRFVQVYCGSGCAWDAHMDLEGNHRDRCGEMDLPVATLMRDLKARGLLKDTLVVWGGEFGRTPMSELGTGRDHNPFGFSMMLAGAGITGGRVVGATDDLGLRAVERPIHLHDFHATLLALLGVDQDELVFNHHGRDEKLTVNGGQVIAELMA